MGKQKTIKLDAFGIEITLDGKGGSITSDLERETCPYCGSHDCCFSCDESQAGGFNGSEDEPKDDVMGRLQFNGALDALESLILAHACAGIAVNSPAYLEGIETTVTALGNQFG